ncbi:MAG: hypothetical protein K6G75_02500 [Lachnospiraceae bacterium]|nr:hypothetical protein [Lachnospiraceae bacterium]
MGILYIFFQVVILYFLILAIVEKNVKPAIVLGVILLGSIALEFLAYWAIKDFLQAAP